MQILRGLIHRMSQKPAAEVARVQSSSDGFVAKWGDGRTEVVKWSEIERIFTYKVDCYSYDMIWLAFERSGHDEALHIWEEVEGLQGLMSSMGWHSPR